MAVTITNNVTTYSNASFVRRFNSVAGTFTSVITNSDLFTDTAVVGDMLYFQKGSNSSYSGMRNVRFPNISTSFAATAVTFVWEYYNGSAWVELPNVVNGDAITLTGAQNVTWDYPPDWSIVLIDGISLNWVRCRIDALTTITEGGANTGTILMGENRLNIVGGTSSVPETIENIYAQIVADGLTDYVERTGVPYAYTYTFNTYTAFDGYFQIKNCSLFWYRFVSFYGLSGWVKFGEVANATYNTGKNGCNVTVFSSGADNLIRQNNLSEFYFYGSILRGFGRAFSSGIFRFFGSVIGINDWNSASLYLYNTSFFNLVHVPGAVLETDNAVINLYIAYQSGTRTINNSVIANAIILRYGALLTTTNSTFPSVADNRVGDVTDAVWTDRFDFSLRVQNVAQTAISDATVVIVDNLGTTIATLTTDGSGDITPTTLIRQVYTMIYPSGSTTVAHTPHTITITKAGYQTKIFKVTMNVKRQLIVTLEKQVDAILGRGQLLINPDPANSQSDVFV